MRKTQASLNKITSPELPQIILRERLFKLLDRKEQHKATWISGMAGAGKTTLVASYIAKRKYSCIWFRIDEGDDDFSTFFHYLGLAVKKAAPKNKKPLPVLTPEYFAGISVFSQRYFENLSARLPDRSLIVFDDYQKVSPISPFHEIFKNGISKISGNIHIIIISRTVPPPSFAALVANRKMRIIGSADLCLNRAESKNIVEIEIGKKRAGKFSSQIYEKTNGWAAGIILMAKSVAKGDEPLANPDTYVPQEIFDYFVGELFDKMDKSTQNFLLETAPLSRLTVPMAEELTGMSDAGRLLSCLRSNNIFTERLLTATPTYQYHALFRAFLMEKATQTFNHHTLIRMKQRAALVLVASGHPEEAVELFFAAGDMDGLIPVILSSAKTLIVQGRNKTLESWIKRIPKDLLNGYPWLLYWLGVSCQHFSATEARWYFEQAFHHFENSSDTAGLLLSWAGIIDSIVYQWSCFTDFDPLIEWVENWLHSGQAFPSPEIEAKVIICFMNASLIRKPERPDMIPLVEKALALSRKSDDFILHLQAFNWAMTYYSWIGNFAGIETLINESKKLGKSHQAASSIMTIHWKWVDALNRIYTLSDIASLPAEINEVLNEISRTGLYIWEHLFLVPAILSSLFLGELSAAGLYLKRFEAILDDQRMSEYCIFHILAANHETLKGNMSRALIHAETATKIAEETGYILPTIIGRIQWTYLLHKNGEFKKALEELHCAYTTARETKSYISMFMALLVYSKISFDEGKEQKAIEYLQEAMSLGSKHNFLNLHWWVNPEILAQLYAKALEKNIEVDYAKRFIRQHKLTTNAPPHRVEHWPWAVKIYTLEKFIVLIDSNPLLFQGKVQKRPLDLLKAVISYGVVDVRVDKIIDSLWGGVDGDMGHSSFSTTLNRLRALLVHKEAIQVKDGKISLNHQLCWIDTMAFRRALEEAEELAKKNNVKEAVALYEKGLSFYKGHFLTGDDNKSWIISHRERLKNIFILHIAKLGTLYEHEQKYGKAIACYEKGLEVDNLEEKFYQRLMLCHHHRGHKMDCVKTYQRCQESLATTLGVEPSSETQKLYEKIMA